jgi:Ca2+-binding EF-hand superfamily protein
MTFFLTPLLPIMAGVAAQSAPAAGAPAPVTHHWGRLFMSPTGEPFRAERGGDALALWFAEADRNHDGYLTLDEMLADAERFFGVLDTNHDGEIDPDEISHYEDVIAPEIRSGPRIDLASAGDDGQHQEGHGRHGHGKSNGSSEWRQPREGETHEGAARFGLLDLPEPVASADADFNRGVSLQEFRQAATQRFVALDLDHHGRLSLAELEMMRPPPEASPHKPEGSGDIDTQSVP